MKRLLVLALCLGLALFVAAPAFASTTTNGGCPNGDGPFDLTVNVKVKADLTCLLKIPDRLVANAWLVVTDGAGNKYHTTVGFINPGSLTFTIPATITGYSKFGQLITIPKCGVRLFFKVYLNVAPFPGSTAAGTYTIDSGTQTTYAKPGGSETVNVCVVYPCGASRTVIPAKPLP